MALVRSGCLNVFVAATYAWQDGENDSIRCGLYLISNDLQAEMKQMGSLAWAIWADENGIDVPERRS